MSGYNCKTLNLEQVHVFGYCDLCVTLHSKNVWLLRVELQKPWHFIILSFLSCFLWVHLTGTSSPCWGTLTSDSKWLSDSRIFLYSMYSIVTVAYFSHLSMSVMWLSYASVPVLQRVERIGSMGNVRETVQDMQAIHVFGGEGWVISTCTALWVKQQQEIPAESLCGTFTLRGKEEWISSTSGLAQICFWKRFPPVNWSGTGLFVAMHVVTSTFWLFGFYVLFFFVFFFQSHLSQLHTFHQVPGMDTDKGHKMKRANEKVCSTGRLLRI